MPGTHEMVQGSGIIGPYYIIHMVTNWVLDGQTEGQLFLSYKALILFAGCHYSGLLTQQGQGGGAQPPCPDDSLGFLPTSHLLCMRSNATSHLPTAAGRGGGGPLG